MKVFISHKSEDMKLAEKIANTLKYTGLNIYLDKYDPLIKESSDRAKRLESQIRSSTDLLVLITENTKESWWVPFEIGLSTAHDIRIASLVFGNALQLPSFITKWPVINSKEKFSMYLEELDNVRLQHLNESHNLRKSMTGESRNFSASNTMRQSERFHDVLLRKFGQK